MLCPNHNKDKTRCRINDHYKLLITPSMAHCLWGSKEFMIVRTHPRPAKFSINPLASKINYILYKAANYSSREVLLKFPLPRGQNFNLHKKSERSGSEESAGAA